MSQHKRNTDTAHEAIRKKSDAMFKRVMAIINKMKVDNESINFNSVAKVASVSKSWLYRHEELSAVIEELRTAQPDDRPASRITSDNESKNVIIDALKQRIQKLESENKELRIQVEIVYGELHLLSKK
jgi:hypothetical protein